MSVSLPAEEINDPRFHGLDPDRYEKRPPDGATRYAEGEQKRGSNGMSTPQRLAVPDTDQISAPRATCTRCAPTMVLYAKSAGQRPYDRSDGQLGWNRCHCSGARRMRASSSAARRWVTSATSPSTGTGDLTTAWWPSPSK